MLGKARVLRPTGHWGRAALISCLRASRCFWVGVWKRPSAVRHSKVAPQRSTREPSCSILLSFSTCRRWSRNISKQRFTESWRWFNYITATLSMKTDQFAWGLCWAGLSQGVNIPTNGDLSPYTWFGLFRKPTPWVHYEHAIGCQAIHVAVGIFPFRCLFLWARQTVDDDATLPVLINCCLSGYNRWF